MPLSISSEQWKWIYFTVLAQLQANSKENILPVEQSPNKWSIRKHMVLARILSTGHLACFLRKEKACTERCTQRISSNRTYVSLAPSRCNPFLISSAPESSHKWPLSAPFWSAIFTTALLEPHPLPPTSSPEQKACPVWSFLPHVNDGSGS